MKPGIIVDNFAGGGGASTGIEAALGRAIDIAINHDEEAIRMHEVNHPGTHHIRNNVWQVDPRDIAKGRHVQLAWFSPDCKHFSKAKGGKPREKSIRDLAWVVVLWAQRVKPDLILLENVEEFRTWGPLCPDGYPIKERAGETFAQWTKALRKAGYKMQWKELRACDYGAPTIRKRFFMIARRDGEPIVWPAPTHGRPDSPDVLSGKLKPWRTAAEIIDWSIPCPSIFERKKLPAEETCRRIASGVMRRVVHAERPFIVPHANDNSTGAGAGIVPLTHRGDAHRIYPLSDPLPTVTGAHRGELALTAASLIKLRNNCADEPVETPLGAITAGGLHHGLVTAFMAQHNAGNGCQPRAMTEPLSTITGRGTQQQPVEVTMVDADALTPEMMDRAVLVAAFLIKYYGNEEGGHGLDRPLGTVTVKDRFAVITVTIDAATYIIVDIGMRMLTARELFNAQGFPPDYIIDRDADGRPMTKTSQVARCGNSVPPVMAEALVRANMAEAIAESEAVAA